MRIHAHTPLSIEGSLTGTDPTRGLSPPGVCPHSGSVPTRGLSPPGVCPHPGSVPTISLVAVHGRRVRHIRQPREHRARHQGQRGNDCHTDDGGNRPRIGITTDVLAG